MGPIYYGPPLYMPLCPKYKDDVFLLNINIGIVRKIRDVVGRGIYSSMYMRKYRTSTSLRIPSRPRDR